MSKSLSEQVADLEADYNTLKGQLEDCRSGYRNVKAERDRLATENAEFEAIGNRSLEKISDLEAENATLRRERDQLKADAMSDYTPNTEEIRDQYTREQPPKMWTVWERLEAFNRWLAAELRKAKAEALREAAEALGCQPSTCKSPGCHRADQIALEDRADQIEEDQ